MGLWASAAWAGSWVVSGGGGFDLPLNEPWAGVDVALHPTQDGGIEPAARITPAFGFGDMAPVVFAEAGAYVRVPEDEAVLRLGLLIEANVAVARYRLPLMSGDPRDGWALGVVPGAQLDLQFAWTPDAPLVVGARGGPIATASDYACTVDGADPAYCVTWHPGFGGGLYARKQTARGLSIEASLGTTSWLLVGHTVGRRDRGEPPG